MRTRLFMLWCSLAPNWLFTIVWHVSRWIDRALYLMGRRSARCYYANTHRNAQLSNGHYAWLHCQLPAGHPRSQAHRSGPYTWENT